MREAFKQQLDSAVPCSGDYLDGKTREAIIESWSIGGILPPTPFEVIEQKIQEWTDHVGQKLVYFLALREGGFEVLSIWSDEIDSLSDHYELIENQSNSIPFPTLKSK